MCRTTCAEQGNNNARTVWDKEESRSNIKKIRKGKEYVTCCKKNFTLI